MRIEQLEYVTVVTRLGSFRAAAAELHISQPALSVTIRNLERELGVDILERRRSGTTISPAGRELLPEIQGVLEAADRLRRAANDQHRSPRVVRLGSVNAATVALVTPAIRAFHEEQPQTQVEVIAATAPDIHRSVLDGAFDLGLITLFEGDDPAPDLESTEVLRCAPVVCMRADDPLAAHASVSTADLLTRPLIAMRPGYLMHRYVHRLLAGRSPAASYATDGAEMAKVLVAEGLGVSVLPSFSVVDDPLERRGVLVHRPLDDNGPKVILMLVRRPSAEAPAATTALHRLLVSHAGRFARTAA